MKSKLREIDFIHAAANIGCSVATIKAVCKVESRGRGFNPDGTPITLFEGHKFYRFTNGKFTNWANRDISYRRWVSTWYQKSWQGEQARIQKAMRLDREAAIKSASWGLFQIMGFNYKLCGFKTLQDFVNAMYESERAQLDAFVQFIKSTGLDDELRDKRFEAFTYRYNGSGQVAKYTAMLTKAYRSFA